MDDKIFIHAVQNRENDLRAELAMGVITEDELGLRGDEIYALSALPILNTIMRQKACLS